MEVREREVVELQGQAQALRQEGKDGEEVDGQRDAVERKFTALQAPLRKRRENLMASREIHQFNRDVEDEIVRPDARRLSSEDTVCLQWTDSVLRGHRGQMVSSEDRQCPLRTLFCPLEDPDPLL